MEEPISKVSINKYDPYQLKGSLDDEMVFVRMNVVLLAFRSLKIKASKSSTSIQI